MTVLARTKLQVAHEGFSPLPLRTAQIVRLPKQTKKQASWWLPLGLGVLVIGIVAGAAINHSLPSLKPVPLHLALPDLHEIIAQFISQSDPEASAPNAETMIPPPSDVVVPVPIVSALPPSLEKVVGNNIDTSAGITLPASSLQVPDPDADAAPKPITSAAALAVAEAISDAPALQPNARAQITEKTQTDAAQIEVHKVAAPGIGRLIDQAQAKMDSGEDEVAMALYAHILTRDHANRVALAGQAFAAQRLGRYDIAVNANRRLLALDPRDDTARSNLAAALSSSNTPAAIKELQRLADGKPDFAPGQEAMAEGLARHGNVLAALPYARHASGLEPDNVYYRLDMAVIYDNLGHSGEAIKLYQQVLRACEAMEGNAPVLPVPQIAIRQRVGYLETLMASAENLAPQQ